MKRVIFLVITCVILIGLCSPVSASAATSECPCDQCGKAVYAHGEDEIVVPLRAERCDICGVGTLRPHGRTTREIIDSVVCTHATWNLHYTYLITEYRDYICDYCGDWPYSIKDREYTGVWCTFLESYI